MYPGLDPSVACDGWLSIEESERKGLLMAREIIALSRQFLTTSEYAADLARSDARPEDAPRVQATSFAHPPVVRRNTGLVDNDLICSFGVVNGIKRPELVIDAFARLAARHPRARLAFVGPVATNERDLLITAAAARGVGDRVVITGRVGESDYRRWLAKAAVAVQLRTFSNGEQSAAVADCLAHGVPTVVTDTGAVRNLPEDCVAKVAEDASVKGLVQVIVSLLDDRKGRAVMARRARAYAARHTFERASSELLRAVGAVTGNRIRRSSQAATR
jgi:glycosyltransferase involved in cell wall biosynthesis